MWIPDSVLRPEPDHVRLDFRQLVEEGRFALALKDRAGGHFQIEQDFPMRFQPYQASYPADADQSCATAYFMDPMQAGGRVEYKIAFVELDRRFPVNGVQAQFTAC